MKDMKGIIMKAFPDGQVHDKNIRETINPGLGFGCFIEFQPDKLTRAVIREGGSSWEEVIRYIKIEVSILEGMQRRILNENTKALNVLNALKI